MVDYLVVEIRYNVDTHNFNRAQVGKFTTFEKAEERLIQLANMGLRVVIEERK